MPKKIIRITEQDLHSIIIASVKSALKESLFSPEKQQQIDNDWNDIDNMYNRDSSNDELNIELDRNLNKDDMRDMARSYAMNDPIHQKVKGSTLRDHLKASMGNNMTV